MKKKISFLNLYRVCKQKNISKILNFKDMPFMDEFVSKENIGKEFLHDIDIFLCHVCLTVQTQHDVNVYKYYNDYEYSVENSSLVQRIIYGKN